MQDCNNNIEGILLVEPRNSTSTKSISNDITIIHANSDVESRNAPKHGSTQIDGVEVVQDTDYIHTIEQDKSPVLH